MHVFDWAGEGNICAKNYRLRAMGKAWEPKLVYMCNRHHESECTYSNVQADKVVQLYETMLTRHTCMVVGPTGGGKSVVINTLAQSQTR